MLRPTVLALLAASTVHAEEFTFSAMGCGPYTPPDEQALVAFIRTENKDKAADFIVHLGDIVSGKTAQETELGEDYYAKIRGYLTRDNAIPTYIVPGDNEWNDRPDPDAGWKHWTKQLMHLETHFKPDWKTEYQPERPENFAFVRKGVLLVGINLVGGRVHDEDEWARRFDEDNAWIGAQFAKHRGDTRAAVVMAQANPVGFGDVAAAVAKTYGPFNKVFVGHAAAFGKPVLFLHADGHKWIEDHPWKDAPNVTRVQVDLINASFPPVRVTVRDGSKDVFAFDRRLPKQPPK